MKEKIHLFGAVLALGLVIVTIILATKLNTVTVSTEYPGLKNTIAVSGSGTMSTQPDEAYLYVSILTQAATAEEAQSQNADIADDVIKALRNAGIAKDDIETSSYNLYPRYDYERYQRIIGYELTHVLKVKTNDIEDVGKFSDAAVQAGANGINRVSFQLSDAKQQSIMNDALAKATDNAKEKAESIAKNLNVNVGGVVSVSESNLQYRPYEYYGMAMMDEAVKAESVPTQISPQELEVTAYISLVFEIK
ncbi:SIMPL domain-containing protein [Candidatus Woesearchaeota archaeon]|nr:SIMPL domain-containing protein [Candidatus Woesearchaeota archaeon]